MEQKRHGLFSVMMRLSRKARSTVPVRVTRWAFTNRIRWNGESLRVQARTGQQDARSPSGFGAELNAARTEGGLLLPLTSFTHPSGCFTGL